jgi:enoyl-CoA hydratase
LAQHFMAAPDFYEGVRAAIIDKDQSPHWQPASVADVSDDDVARYFEPSGEPDLDLSERL